MTKKKKEMLETMKKIGKVSFLINALFLFFINVASADTQVSVLLDRNQVGLGEPFNFKLRIQSDEDFEVPIPDFPSVVGIEVINAVVGMRQSASHGTFGSGGMQFVTKIVQEYDYLLAAQKEGKLIIPVIDVVINGKTYKTQPLTVDVGDQYRGGGGRGKPRPGAQFPPGYGEDEAPANPFGSMDEAEDLFEQMLRQQQRLFGQGGMQANPFGQPNQPQQVPSKNLNINTRDNFFVYLDVDKTVVYEGEQVTANWYIYTRTGIESLDRVKFPDLKGFWKEIIEEVPQLQFTEEIVNGVPYRKALLASHALFPIKAGVAVVDEFKIKAKLRSMAQFGWGKPYDVTKASKRTEIKVLPLPQEGKSLSFSGAVGTYRVNLRTDETSYPAHQPFSVRVRYEGLGNAKLIDLPAINWPEGLEVYDTKSEAKFYKEGNSFKEFEILVIPRRTGEMTIPAVELSYFDPAQKNYVTEKTEPIVLTITEGQPNSSLNNSTNPALNQANSSELNSIPSPIFQLPEAGFNFAQYRWWTYLFLLVAGVLFSLLYSYAKMRKLKVGNLAILKIIEKIEQIEFQLGHKNLRLVGAEATNLIYLMTAQLAGQKNADQEMHMLVKEIPLQDQEKYLNRINKLFDYFQLLGFSPEEIMQNIILKTPVFEQFQELKKLADEVVEKLKKEDKNNS